MVLEAIRRLSLPTLLALVALLSGSPAFADVVQITLAGTIAPWIWNGTKYVQAPLIDQTGVFTSPGASLTGDAFTVVWTVDTACPGCSSVTTAGGQINAYGGSQYNNTQTPILGGVLTINGNSVTYGANALYGVIQVSTNSFYVNVTESLVNGGLGNVAMNTGVGSTTPVFPFSLVTPFTYTFDPLTNTYFCCGPPAGIGGSFELTPNLDGFFDVSRIALTDLTPTPFRLLSRSSPPALPVYVCSAGAGSGNSWQVPRASAGKLGAPCSKLIGNFHCWALCAPAPRRETQAHFARLFRSSL
jgi:hypothetical protein